MDSLFHFLFGFIAALALDLHKRHKLWFVGLAALMGVLLDFDYFLTSTTLRPFHNVFIAIVLPIGLFFILRHFRSHWSARELEFFFLVMAAMLTGHLVADMFLDHEAILFPLTDATFSFVDLQHLIPFEFKPFISPLGIALVVYTIVILLIRFAEDYVYFRERRKHSVEKSLGESMENFF
ncbi:hypothetical protein KJ765_02695 [Candidatus Micrarchaeota archaeon]|nr:hypothetical protein [Candidatus Micrarchaeota archaeon]